MYSQDNQDCDSSTFQLRIQDNQDFSGTHNCTRTFSQDSCGHNSKLEETNRAQGAMCGLVELSTVAVFTSPAYLFQTRVNFARRGVLPVGPILRSRSRVQRVPLALTWLHFMSGFFLLVYPITKD